MNKCRHSTLPAAIQTGFNTVVKIMPFFPLIFKLTKLIDSKVSLMSGKFKSPHSAKKNCPKSSLFNHKLGEKRNKKQVHKN